MTEQQAIAQLRAGDIEGLAWLVQRYQQRALHTAYLILGDRSAAEDVVQSAFLRAWERIQQFDPSRPFAPWFLKSVSNEALRRLTRQRPHLTLEDLEAAERTLAPWLTDPAPGPDQHAEELALREALQKALTTLSAQQRAAVVLRYYAGLSEAEIAERMGTPRGTVKSRLHAAHRRLRQLLAPLRLSAANPPLSTGDQDEFDE
ncbi:MAG: RNA polymerase sigma factor [Anaerolineae bacterium]|nr:sigma-70 family RNA polymerase sigma factor [Chloroflexota bacterium]